MTNQTDLVAKLRSSHQKFISYIDALSEKEFEFSNDQKWTAGQELDYIVKSTLPISQVLNNKTFIKSKFGTIDRALLSYGELVDKYHEPFKTENGYEIPGEFVVWTGVKD